MFEPHQVSGRTRYDVTSWILEEYVIYQYEPINKHLNTINVKQGRKHEMKEWLVCIIQIIPTLFFAME